MFMARLFLIITVGTFWLRYIGSFNVNKKETCHSLTCDSSSNISVCGIRKEASIVRFKLFANECALLKYGCSAEDKDAYGLISMEYCKRSNLLNTDSITPENEIVTRNSKLTRGHETNENSECDFACHSHEDWLCGIRQDGEGYRVKLFKNTCELMKQNCNTAIPFIRTDMFICERSLEGPDNSPNDNNVEIYQPIENNTALGSFKNIIVVDGSMLGQTTDANETIENFFAATHVLDLPIREINDQFKTRRMLLKNVGPVKVFQPWITIPKTIKTDYHHMPTLSTCYHKCPTQCPDTYSPVCGVPGILAREPSIMFQNHCYMDVAQCKMYWENKSYTAISSSYIESSFLFCLGDQLNGMYRFLPLIKTLQHMGRLKKKGKFRYRLKNMRFFNNYAYKEPKLMG